ncbi:MAG: Bacterial membrane protein YfhO [Syntrophorhabdus sp. PtaU1.Bin153]|nr:MAG: Bacterial membrane protein YfhO [Syntrophorhabdus sp. PtaU1.Bin153]
MKGPFIEYAARPRSWVPLLFVSLALLYFLPMLDSKNIFVERDLAAFFIPPKYLWVSMVKSFHLPLWNPFNYSGIPLLATLQPGVFYPLHALYFFLPFNVAWNWLIILHFALAGFATYLLLRYFRASAGAALLGGVIFMLSGYLISVHNLLPHLFASAWLPLAMITFLKYFETRYPKYLVLSALFLAVQFCAGAPEMVLMSIAVLSMLTAFAPSFLPVGPAKSLSFLTRTGALVLVLLLFLLLSSVQLLPFLELKSQSIRTAGLPYQEAITWSFAWKDFIQFFVPDAFGYFSSTKKYWSNQSWLLTLYWGITPFLLSVFYFASGDKKRLVFLSLMVVSLVFALGHNTPAYRFLYLIPPFNSIRYPVKFIFIFILLVSVTAGLGFDSMRKGVSKDSPQTKWIISIFFYAGFAFVILWGYMSLFGDTVHKYFDSTGFKPDAYNHIVINAHNIKRFLLFSFIFCVMLLVYLRVRHKKTASFVVMFVVASDLFLANSGYYTSAPWQSYITTKQWGEHSFSDIANNRDTERYLVSLKTLREFNCFPYDRVILSPPYAALFGLYSVGGAEVLRVGHHEAFANLITDSLSPSYAKRFLHVAGVRFITTSFTIADKDFALLQSMEVGGKTIYLYEYLPYPGRFLFFGKALSTGDDRETVNKMNDPSVNLTTELVIRSDIKTASRGRNGQGKTRLISYKPDNMVIYCEADSDGFLYASDTYYPGWKAYVDGKETGIYRANLAFRAVPIPKGNHTVSFRYVPLSFYSGLGLTIIGILLSVWIVKRGSRKRQKSR